jgi:beta-galactosidase GanA
MWPAIFAKMRAAGLNTVDSYVFWNYHVRTEDQATKPDYEGRGNVTSFLELAAAADLFVIWRLGPYINAEWLDGGYPSWVKAKCGKDNPVRTATQPYMNLTADWMQSHVDTIRPYFATNGGPIILAQMDNELGGAKPEYISWLAQLAAQLHTGVPWIMCNGQHFNGSMVTCNGIDCRSFAATQMAKGLPALWTEDEQWCVLCCPISCIVLSTVCVLCYQLSACCLSAVCAV